MPRPGEQVAWAWPFAAPTAELGASASRASAETAEEGDDGHADLPVILKRDSCSARTRVSLPWSRRRPCA
jgi:hypothetical protein